MMRSPAARRFFNQPIVPHRVRTKYSAPSAAEKEAGLFSLMEGHDSPTCSQPLYFDPRDRYELSTKVAALRSKTEYRTFLVEQQEMLQHLRGEHQKIFVQLLEQQKTGMMKIADIESFIQQTQRVLTWWECVFFHSLFSCDLFQPGEETNIVLESFTILNDIFYSLHVITQNCMNQACMTDNHHGYLWMRIFNIYSGIRNAPFISQIVGHPAVIARLNGALNLLATPAFLEHLATCYQASFFEKLLNVPFGKAPDTFNLRYFQQIMSEHIESARNFYVQLVEKTGAEQVKFSFFRSLAETHHQMSLATLSKAQSVSERHLEKYIHYLMLMTKQILEQRDRVYDETICFQIPRDGMLSELIPTIIPAGLGQTREAEKRLFDVKVKIALAVTIINKIKTSPTPTTTDLAKMKQHVELLHQQAGVLTQIIEREKITTASVVEEDSTSAVSVSPKVIKKEQKKERKPSSWRIKTEKPPLSQPLSPSSSSSSTMTSVSVSSTIIPYSRRITREEQEKDKMKKRRRYIDTTPRFHRPEPVLPKAKTEEYTFDFPIVAKTIKTRLDVEACYEQIGDDIYEILPKLLAILARAHCSGKQGEQGIKYVPKTEQRKLLRGVFPKDALVFKIKALGVSADKIGVYGMLVETVDGAQIVFNYVLLLNNVHKQVCRRGHHSIAL